MVRLRSSSRQVSGSCTLVMLGLSVSDPLWLLLYNPPPPPTPDLASQLEHELEVTVRVAKCFKLQRLSGLTKKFLWGTVCRGSEFVCSPANMLT